MFWVNVKGMPCAKAPSYLLHGTSPQLCKHRAGTSNEKGGPRAQASKVLQIPSAVLEGVFVPWDQRFSQSNDHCSPQSEICGWLNFVPMALLYPRWVSLPGMLPLWIIVHQRHFGNCKLAFLCSRST